MSQVTLYPPGTTVGSSAYAYCVVLGGGAQGGAARGAPGHAAGTARGYPFQQIHKSILGLLPSKVSLWSRNSLLSGLLTNTSGVFVSKIQQLTYESVRVDRLVWYRVTSLIRNCTPPGTTVRPSA